MIRRPTVSVILFALAAASSAQAGMVEIREPSRCVNATVQRVHDSITDYAGYVSLPGASYDVSVAGSSRRLIQMIESTPNYSSRTGQATDARVDVRLKPLDIANEALYPRFQLHCRSGLKNGSAAMLHACTLDPTKPHFGLDDFRSVLNIIPNDPACATGQTRLDYTIQMTGDTADVNAIKAEALRPAGMLAPLLGALFNEEMFFRSYYVNFYNGWINQL